MSVILITGSAGLIGSQAAFYFHDKGYTIIGIDNDHRKFYFGEDASTAHVVDSLKEECQRYTHYNIDIRQADTPFIVHNKDIVAVIHCASQPSHDWAATNPEEDFGVNAFGTLHLLELTRKYCPKATFIFTSTSKVYGDRPNTLPLIELDSRYELAPPWEHGIPETLSIDYSMHSLFGVSKASADLLVQEYGRYFGIKTVCFRPGCLSGPNHAGVEQHGFLSYLVKCAVHNKPYQIFGNKGKQVRDNIHSYDLVTAFDAFLQKPKTAAIYNLGGGRHSNCSILEAIADCQNLTGNRLAVNYNPQARKGDHIFFVGDTRKWQEDYPEWSWKYDHYSLLKEMIELESLGKR